MTTSLESKPSTQTAIAKLLHERHRKLFPNRRAAANVVNAVLDGLVEILLEEGAIYVRRLGRLRVVEGRVSAPAFPGKGASVQRRRVSFRTAEALMNRLNPDHPRKKAKE